MLYEVNLIGWLADGYYVRSLTAIMVEGEIGYPVLLDPTPVEPVSTSTDEALIAGFSSRGFATFSFDFLSQVSHKHSRRLTFNPLPPRNCLNGNFRPSL